MYDRIPSNMYCCLYKMVVDIKVFGHNLVFKVSFNHFVVQMYLFGTCIYFMFMGVHVLKWQKNENVITLYMNSEKYENIVKFV